MEGARGSAARGGGRRPCRSVIEAPHLLCLIDDDGDESMKGAEWTAMEVDASRRMALTCRFCGVLPITLLIYR